MQKHLKPLLYFSVIVMLMAFMDGFNFYFPHNQGWLSLTYGVGSNSWDVWHILKRLILFVFFMYIYGFKPKHIDWLFMAGIFALVALIGQVLIYDVFIKLF